MFKSVMSRRIMAVLFSACLVFAVFFSFEVKATAATPGNSDLLRMYSIQGVDKNADISALAYLYGDAKNESAAQYAVILKVHSRNKAMGMDVISGAQFNEMLKNSLTTSQVNIGNMNAAVSGSTQLSVEYEKAPLVAALENAMASGKSSMIVKNNLIAAPDTLKYIAQKAGKNFRINFDTWSETSFNARVSVNPANTTKGFSVLAGAYSDPEHPTIEKFNKIYSNKFVCVDFMQIGSFGTTVGVVARVDLKGLNTKSLAFYAYDGFKNEFKTMKTPEYSIDDQGYLRFSTSVGGTILISDKALVKK